ncbi:MAG: response regulator FixJ [Rhizobium rhizophilum]|uniref:response regulator FixJ n=1 Tax=Rhizobium rhizophilum TaxID=1850373 RepID=UPI00391C5D0F
MQPDDFTVHIVDDEETLRKSLGFMLTVNGFAVRLHPSATTFSEIASSLRNAILITDMRMPDMSGLDLVRKISSISPPIPSIIVTGHGDIPMAVEAMKAGAVDFIEKPFEESVIIEAVRRAAEKLADSSAGTLSADDIRSRIGSLSERERQILSAVVAGQPNKAIAFNLDISPRTVEVHRANVMTKMRARSLPELVRMSLTVSI